ncbi:uncharacterized protein LOC111915931 [Lactuca sativa]|uniref:uncharacterized protein LOC111915931 n=1 Tax=Lactuca sativa TaxID=4236 RepID=UPI000CD87E61|nr:uncharacterized protein LOC111915931 [Lactuca sativa]
MHKCAKFLQDLLDTLQQLDKTSKVVLNKQCSIKIIEGIPTKIRKPGRLTLPCEFGNSTKTFDLANFGAIINLMPYSFYQNLELPSLKTTRMANHMSNRLVTYPNGIVEYLLVKIGKFVFPVDFVVIDMKDDEDVPIILGCQLLNTARVVVDIQELKLILRVRKDERTFEVDEGFNTSRAQDEVFFLDDDNELE